MLRKLAEDLWVVDRPLSVAGVELGARMTIVRLPDGALFLHSPVALDDRLRDALSGIGTPRFAVAPNRFHHLFVGGYRAAFPDIRLYAAPGLPEKRPDIAFDAVLTGPPPPEWEGIIDQEHVRGLPLISEVVFHHRPSRTLLICDLAFHYGPDAPFLTRWLFRLAGGYGQLAPTWLEWMLVRDRGAMRRSMERVLAWDFDRVVVSHGAVLETGGREALRRGYAWLS